MEAYVGLDASLKDTSVCILDKDGARVFESQSGVWAGCHCPPDTQGVAQRGAG